MGKKSSIEDRRAHGTPPTGILVNQTGCKAFHIGSPSDSTLSDQDCIEYQYDGDSLLLLKHINAGFNCCSQILSDIRIEDSIITIEESEFFENGAACDCGCLFDLDFEIRNLGPGEYAIKVIEPYVHPGEELLQFTVSLSSSPSSGVFCAHRDCYPWGN